MVNINRDFKINIYPNDILEELGANTLEQFVTTVKNKLNEGEELGEDNIQLAGCAILQNLITKNS